MIKTIEQAKAIQKRRVKAEKRGYAKAVRRFLRRECSTVYKEVKAHFPVVWDGKKEAA